MTDYKKKYVKYYNKYYNLLYAGGTLDEIYLHYRDLRDYEIEFVSYYTDGEKILTKNWYRIDLDKLKNSIKYLIDESSVIGGTIKNGYNLCISKFKENKIFEPADGVSVNEKGDIVGVYDEGIYTIWPKSLWVLYYTSQIYKADLGRMEVGDELNNLFTNETPTQRAILTNSVYNARINDNFDKIYEIYYNNFSIETFRNSGY